MSTLDAAVMWLGMTIIAAAGYWIVERVFPRNTKAEDLGYMPGTEAPPWGWKVAIPLGLAAVGLFLFAPAMAARIIGI